MWKSFLVDIVLLETRRTTKFAYGRDEKNKSTTIHSQLSHVTKYIAAGVDIDTTGVADSQLSYGMGWGTANLALAAASHTAGKENVRVWKLFIPSLCGIIAVGQGRLVEVEFIEGWSFHYKKTRLLYMDEIWADNCTSPTRDGNVLGGIR